MLPEEVKDKIYKYKHQIQFKSVMDELLLHRLNTAFNLTLDMVEMMLYYDHQGCARKVVNIDNIECFAHEILAAIFKKKNNLYHNYWERIKIYFLLFIYFIFYFLFFTNIYTQHV